MSAFTSGWHLIYTMPNQERKVSARLTERNIQTYLPLSIEKRQWNDRIKTVHLPLFPSYVFVYLTSLYDYYEGINVDGSCSYVKFGTQHARVSDREIMNIRTLENKGQNVEVSTASFQPGQQVFIEQGPLAGLCGEVVQHKGKQRILVRVSMLQRSLLADLPGTSLSAG